MRHCSPDVSPGSAHARLPLHPIGTEALATFDERREVPRLSVNDTASRLGVASPLEPPAEPLLHGTEHECAAVIGPLIELLRSDRSFPEVLRHLVHFVTVPAGRPPGCLLAECHFAPGRLGPVTTASVDEVTDEPRDAYEQWFRQAQARREVDSAISPDVATHFIGTQFTAVLMSIALGAEPHLVRAQAELAFTALTRTARRSVLRSRRRRARTMVVAAGRQTWPRASSGPRRRERAGWWSSSAAATRATRAIRPMFMAVATASAQPLRLRRAARPIVRFLRASCVPSPAHSRWGPPRASWRAPTTRRSTPGR